MPLSRDVALGRAFWRQALADRQAAESLWTAGYLASALAACQHAVEKALKAALFIEAGAGGFQLRHDMSSELYHLRRFRLPPREQNQLLALERLLPPPPRRSNRRNTEYPWSSSPTSTRVYHPHAQFRSRQQVRRFLRFCDRLHARLRHTFPELEP